MSPELTPVKWDGAVRRVRSEDGLDITRSPCYGLRGKEERLAIEARLRFLGEDVSVSELATIQQVVKLYGGLSRMELAATVCELLGWHRANGRVKSRECREWLETLEDEGRLVLPAKRKGRPPGSKTSVPRTAFGEPGEEITGSVRDVTPVVLEPVVGAAEQRRFRELVGRYHYLGHAVPYGAQLRYLVFGSRQASVVLGCVQFSSAAWRMQARDHWIGWDDATRRQNLARVVSNSRFLILPWVRVHNLASTILSRAARRLRADWRERYGVEPLLIETLVDASRFGGGCYRASSWLELGETTGRGRMDRHHRRHGAAPKRLFVRPLVRRARRRLREA